MKDHLGNVRSVVNLSATTASAAVLEQNDYLPFGTRASTPTLNTSNRYRYAGKENQKVGSVDLALLDFGARLYDPYVCSWSSVDPMAEKYLSSSPYSYCMGNPMNIVDPDGNIPFLANIVAGAVSATIDFGMQIAATMLATNEYSLESFINAVKQVDFVDVAMSGVEGALTMGGSIGRKVAVKGVAIAISSEINWNVSDGATVNDSSTAVVEAMVSSVTDGLGKGYKLYFPSKSANKAVEAARSAAHAQGRALSSAEAKSVASNARKVTANLKETSSGIQSGSEGIKGKMIENGVEKFIDWVNETKNK